MDKLEQYLDQVCRGIAGPRALRQHIRRELGEHLRDAIAEHEAAGMSAGEALERALEDFGGPEQVRAELEAQHGHRMMTVVIDKAMQWKEKTMRAKWVWSTWAHAMVLGVIALEVMFVSGCIFFIVPKMLDMGHEGWFDRTLQNELGAVNRWGFSVIEDMIGLWAWSPWIGLAVLALWGLFEWRVRSENKTMMRMGGLGTIAVLLFVAAGFISAALILPTIISLDPYSRANSARTVARDAAAKIDADLAAVDQDVVDNNFSDIRFRLNRVRSDFGTLRATGVGMPLLEESEVDDGRAPIDIANRALNSAHDAAWHGQRDVFDRNMKEFREAYGKLRGKPAATTREK